jgi:hypothetical protein
LWKEKGKTAEKKIAMRGGSKRTATGKDREARVDRIVAITVFGRAGNLVTRRRPRQMTEEQALRASPKSRWR